MASQKIIFELTLQKPPGQVVSGARLVQVLNDVS